jgi:hypothetical protein
MNKKILFVLIVLIGSMAIATFVYYYVGVADIAEYVALFTSVSTAMYAILAEPKEKTEPFLRITPTLKRYGTIAIGTYVSPETVGLDVWIENIGYSIAKDIEVKCQIIPDESIPLKSDGVFKHPLLAPKEIVQYKAVEAVDSNKFLSQRLIIEAAYSNEDDKKQKPIKKEYKISELEEGLKEVKTS